MGAPGTTPLSLRITLIEIRMEATRTAYSKPFSQAEYDAWRLASFVTIVTRLFKGEDRSGGAVPPDAAWETALSLAEWHPTLCQLERLSKLNSISLLAC
jgi:hypothetical protein